MICSTTSLLKVDTLCFTALDNSILVYVTCKLWVGTCCLTFYLDLHLILNSLVYTFKSFTHFALFDDADWIIREILYINLNKKYILVNNEASRYFIPLKDFIYCQYNKVNLRTFLKFLHPITGHLLFVFIHLFIYLFICLLIDWLIFLGELIDFF